MGRVLNCMRCEHRGDCGIKTPARGEERGSRPARTVCINGQLDWSEQEKMGEQETIALFESTATVEVYKSG